MAALAAAAVLTLASSLGWAAADTAQSAHPAATAHGPRHSPYLAAQHARSSDTNYALQWGVDLLQAHQTNAGNLIRFTYRVIDANKARPLIDKAAAPQMISPKANVALQVPVMDKVGALRQSTELETGKTYWMVFSNKGNLVKRGDQVSVVVGAFRVDGLVVQ